MASLKKVWGKSQWPFFLFSKIVSSLATKKLMSKVKRSSSLLPSAIIIYLRLLAVLGGKARRDHTLLSRLKIFLWLSLASAAAPPQKFALTHTFFYFTSSLLPTSRMIVILWSALWYTIVAKILKYAYAMLILNLETLRFIRKMQKLGLQKRTIWCCWTDGKCSI